MARQLTAQQEQYAQNLAAGMAQADAYRKAYPKSVEWKETTLWSEASRSAKNPLVAARVQEIREPAVARVQETIVYTTEVAMREALEALEMAKKTQQPGSMVAAVQLRAKLKGLLIERKEMGQVGEFAAMDAMRKVDAMEAIQLELDRRARLANGSSEVQDVTPKD